MYTEFYNDDNEIWVTVFIDDKYYPSYMVSNQGRVFSLKTNTIMGGTDYKGYTKIKLRDENNKPTLKFKHRIVAESFCDNPNNKPFVNHIDGDKSNNHPNKT